MAKLTPKYTVWYNGAFHRAGETFYVAPADTDEMSEHGLLLKDENAEAREPAAGKRSRRKPAEGTKVEA